MEDNAAVFFDTPDKEKISLDEVLNSYSNLFEFGEEGDPCEGFLVNFFCVFRPFDVFCEPNPKNFHFFNSVKFNVLKMESSGEFFFASSEHNIA